MNWNTMELTQIIKREKGDKAGCQIHNFIVNE